jgi:hypothetical protein
VEDDVSDFGAGGQSPQGQPRQGWYPDPAGSPLLRWYDGGAWTDHLAPPEQVTPEPVTGRTVGKVVLIILAAVLGSIAGLALLFGACVLLFQSLAGY